MVMKAAVQPEIRLIPAGEFKAKCLGLMDEVNQGNIEILITKRGKPFARLVPTAPEEKPFVPLWGRSPEVKILGDIVEPLHWPDASRKWDRVVAQTKSPKTKRKKHK
jgi:prevent-host-death family protein